MTHISSFSRSQFFSEDKVYVQIWLFILAGLIFAIVLLGGATRLTGSGLSITEWRPVTGIIPPRTDKSWEEVFALYRQIPQYTLLNAHMTLDEFKTIYFWEWGHRLLGRFIGFGFTIPYMVFLLTGRIRGLLALSLLGLGILGGLQGFIGWVMVKSGFAPGHIAVAPTRLMAHLLMAHCLCAACVALGVSLGKVRITGVLRVPGGRFLVGALLFLLMAQIALGALVAGLKAGLVYNTWPLMDGRFLPLWQDFVRQSPWWLNGVANPLVVQFMHRIGAYVLVGASGAFVLYTFMKAPYTSFFKCVMGLFILLLTQMCVGIFTLIFQVPIWAGLIHQGLAVMGVMWTVTLLVGSERRPSACHEMSGP